MAARELFSDMKEKKYDFKSCVQFVRRCEELLVTGKFKIEGNAVGKKFSAVIAGAHRNIIDIRCKIAKEDFPDKGGIFIP